METSSDATVNGWRVTQIVCCVLLGVWFIAALPMVSLRFGGFGEYVSRFVDMGNNLYGLELYRHLILTEPMADAYLKGMIVSALPAITLMTLEIYSSMRAKKVDRGY